MINSSRVRPRLLAPVVERALKSHPVVVVTGGRQTGKTTLVKNLASAAGRVFYTLDDLETLDAARREPEELFARGAKVTIDEAQRAPELMLAIKRDVDARRRRGRFLVTGSANLLLMREVADSLAGRAIYLTLAPFTTAEKNWRGQAPPWSELLRCRTATEAVDRAREWPSVRTGWTREVLRGGMPRAVLARTARERTEWFDGFLSTYLERDLRDLSQISALPEYRRLMRLGAHRVGRLLNQTDLGRDAGLAQATAHRYLNLLEITHQIVRLQAYTVNPSKRMIRAPKLYWLDTGIAAHLAGVSASTLRRRGRGGELLENLLLTGLLAWRESVHPRPEVYYWRTAAGAEVDFVIEASSGLLPVEVKAARRVRSSDLRHVESFLDDYRARARWGLVLHGGSEPVLARARIAALPVLGLC